LVKEIRRSFVGILNGTQDTNRYDSLSICLWQSFSPSITNVAPSYGVPNDVFTNLHRIHVDGENPST
jgi:hypothetical protein